MPRPPQPTPPRSPRPPEAEVVAALRRSLEGALDWPAVVEAARPWVDAVRTTPAPFWALQSLLWR
ncbi:hypothetical protein ABXN37_07755 [Piscinibacter sakaiensis]